MFPKAFRNTGSNGTPCKTRVAYGDATSCDAMAAIFVKFKTKAEFSKSTAGFALHPKCIYADLEERTGESFEIARGSKLSASR